MRFEDARLIKLSDPLDKKAYKFYHPDEFALLLHTRLLSFRYIPTSSRKGITELFNDKVHILMATQLYS